MKATEHKKWMAIAIHFILRFKIISFWLIP